MFFEKIGAPEEKILTT